MAVENEGPGDEGVGGGRDSGQHSEIQLSRDFFFHDGASPSTYMDRICRSGSHSTHDTLSLLTR